MGLHSLRLIPDGDEPNGLTNQNSLAHDIPDDSVPGGDDVVKNSLFLQHVMAEARRRNRESGTVRLAAEYGIAAKRRERV
jgi:hypothetical protein